MKILAVRGANLASLGGEFEVDLTSGVLGQVGLFAITGPTGAGKSTLLDAICLCLYDTTPRLASAGGNPVRMEGVEDETALRTNDQRNILRRGTAHGWAEVDFTGRDGHAYTARWEVRRARKSPTGRIQGQEWSLRRMGSDPNQRVTGDKKTEVAAAIRFQVGLDFEQFQRSVMLAQGDFAAFLKATESSRANLLEQMTGSKIYTRLSKAAFQKKRSLETTRNQLEIQRGEHVMLDATARAEAEAELAAAAQRRRRAQEVQKTAETAVAWHTDDRRLSQQLSEAEADRVAAARAVTEAAPRLQQLEARQRAWPLRELATTSQELDARAQQALTKSTEATVRAQQAQQRRDQAARAHATALCAAAGAWSALAAQLEDRHQHALEARGQLATWLTEHGGLVRLVGSDELQRLLGSDRAPGRLQVRQQRVVRRAHLREEERPTTAAALRTARGKLAEATAQRATTQEALTAAIARTAQAHAEVQVIQAKLPADRAAGLSSRRQAHTTLSAILVRAAEALRQQATSTSLAATKREEAHRAELAAAQALQAAATAQTELATSERLLRQSRAAVDSEGLRQQLVPGEACSVCGSTEHPWADGSPLAVVFDELEKAVAGHRTALDGARRQQTEAETLQQAALEATRRAEQQATEASAQLLALSTEWTASCAPLPGPPALADCADHLGAADTASKLAAFEQALLAEEASLASDLSEERRLRAALEQQQLAEREARTTRDAAAARVERAAAEIPTCEAALAELDRQLATLEEQLATLDSELAQTLDPLAEEVEADSPIARWRDHLAAPEPVLDALRATHTAVVRRQSRLSQAATAIETLGAAAPVARSRASLALADLPEGADPVPLVAPAGTPPEQATWLESRAEEADRTIASARLQLEACEKELRTATEVAAAAHAAHLTEASSAATARRQLHDQCTQHGIDAAALQALCALEATWLQTERTALDALGQALQTAQAVELERQKRSQEHLAQRPDADAPTADAQLEAAQAERAAADEAWSTHRLRIATDDQARTTSARFQAAIEAHDAMAEPWLKLAKCIGSSDGKQFRKYAQSLTLELLLEQANLHLQRLHPRYRLARIANTDLDILVIDGDLGDEARTVRNLSGGEGFLVSLALALGLSSLSARDVRIESLFIDEGFGTLDASSLDKALSVLDSLQSEGRKVGIISHVTGLAERIGVRVAVEPQGGGRSTVQVLEH